MLVARSCYIFHLTKIYRIGPGEYSSGNSGDLMKNILLMCALFFSSLVQAAPRTCGDLEKAYTSDSISEFPFSCDDVSCKKLKMSQLRLTAEFIIDGASTHLSDVQLLKLFKPKYTFIYIGKETFDGVKVNFLGSTFVSYFHARTLSIQKFYIDAETLKADQEQCYDIEFKPYHSAARKQHACGEAVKWVNLKVTDIPYNVEDCTYVNNDMVLTATSTTTAKLSIDGKLHNFLGYFCTMELNRITEVLTKVSCKLTGLNSSDYAD